jgi:hypothetical protein
MGNDVVHYKSTAYTSPWVVWIVLFSQEIKVKYFFCISKILQFNNFTIKRFYNQKISQSKDFTINRFHNQQISQSTDFTVKRFYNQQISQSKDFSMKRVYKSLITTNPRTAERKLQIEDQPLKLMQNVGPIFLQKFSNNYRNFQNLLELRHTSVCSLKQRSKENDSLH